MAFKIHGGSVGESVQVHSPGIVHLIATSLKLYCMSNFNTCHNQNMASIIIKLMMPYIRRCIKIKQDGCGCNYVDLSVYHYKPFKTIGKI